MLNLDPPSSPIAMENGGINAIGGLLSWRGRTRTSSNAVPRRNRRRHRGQNRVEPPDVDVVAAPSTPPTLLDTADYYSHLISPASHPYENMSTFQREIMDHLRQHESFSTGLSKALALNVNAFAWRLWILDNSGSMKTPDGNRVVVTADRKITAQNVTRWEELQQTVVYHAAMAALLGSSTTFRLINEPKNAERCFGVATVDSLSVEEDMRKARTIMRRVVPEGVTPLTDHIRNIQREIKWNASELRRVGQRVVIVLATDGLPTDRHGNTTDRVREDFVNALKALEGLPVWLVIRLCTDEDKVTKFYNQLDRRLDLPLEVVDDFVAEAREVNRHNKWINYCLPLHRCRELGYHDRLFDLMDEKPLTKLEVRDYCALLFGTPRENIPSPEDDWRGFLQYIENTQSKEREQWDPIRKKAAPWINVRLLNKAYSGVFLGLGGRQ